MLLREFLLERVSVVSHSNEMRQQINNIVNKHADNVYKQFKNLIDVDTKQINQQLLNGIEPDLEQYLETVVSKYAHKPIKVEFATLEKGTGQYISDISKLLISKKISVNLANLKGGMKYKEVTKKDMAKMPMLNSMYNSLIDNLITIALHEVTHAGQTKTDKHDEFRRSYIEPNVVKFLTQLFDDATEDLLRQKLDLSQPQEIAAYANQAAVEVTHRIHKMSPKQQEQAINVLLKHIQDKSDDKNIPRIVSAYKDISHDGKNELKMYRRFLKLFYQELQTYKEEL